MRRLQDIRSGDPRASLIRRASPHRGLAHRRGGGHQHRAARAPENAVQQDQDHRYIRAAQRSHPPHTQQGVHVVSVQKRHPRGLRHILCVCIKYSN